MQKALSLLFCLMCTVCSWALTVKGVVTDKDGEPLIGATVLELGKPSNATATDIDGAYTINVSSNATLQVSYVGYVTATAKVNGNPTVNVSLVENAEALDEVVVVAFGKMKKEAFTGSAGVLKADDINKSQVSTATQALAGRVAGVQLTNGSSQFGSEPTITIRGLGSISSDTQPLIVVDGMPYDGDIALINPADIESMTVMKDAASNALYGARGANGVVMITTRNSGGQARVSVDMKWGGNSKALQEYKKLNREQFYETFYTSLKNYYMADSYAKNKGLAAPLSAAEAHKLANYNLINTTTTGIGPGYMVYTVPSGQDFIMENGKMNPSATLGALYNYQGTELWLQPDDWAEEGLQTGFRQEYNATVTGGMNGLNYYSSLGYLDQEGIIAGSHERRLTGRVKVDYNARKWLRTGVNISYANYRNNSVSEGGIKANDHAIGIGSIWSVIHNQAPIYPVYLRGADKQIMIDQWNQPMYDFGNKYGLHRGSLTATPGNAIFTNKYREDQTRGNSITANIYADIKPVDWLTFTINGSVYSYARQGLYRTSPFVDHYTSSTDNGYLSRSKSETRNYNTQQLLNFNKTFNGVHEVSALFGHEYYKSTYSYIGASGWNFGIDGASELGVLLNKNYPSSSSSAYNNEGYFFRGQYDYDQKYYANASIRRDASSRFDKSHRWGTFWSAGVAWMINKEEFFNVDWVNSLKLKFSVGSQGNDNIGNFLYADRYDIINNNDEVSYQWAGKGTKNITWETNTNWNVGVEFELFHNRLNGGIEYFYRKTTDMLFSLKTPPSAGYTSYYTNLGDMRNAGFEVNLDGTILAMKDFQWTANFNIGYVKNKVLRLPDEAKTMSVEGHDGYVNVDGSFVSLWRYYVGEGLPLYTWYVRKTAGLNEEGAQLYWKDTVDENGNVTGREKVEDANQASYYFGGDALAPINGGFGTTLKYKGFDLSVNLNFQLGGKTYDYVYNNLMSSGSEASSSNWSVDILKAWSPENKNTDVPRLRAYEQYSQSAMTDRFLTSSSYLNLQNVNFGYTLPANVVRKCGLANLRVYFSGENLGYISARRGLDPRQNIIGITSPELYSPVRTVSGGVQVSF